MDLHGLLFKQCSIPTSALFFLIHCNFKIICNFPKDQNRMIDLLFFLAFCCLIHCEVGKVEEAFCFLCLRGGKAHKILIYAMSFIKIGYWKSIEVHITVHIMEKIFQLLELNCKLQYILRNYFQQYITNRDEIYRTFAPCILMLKCLAVI